MPLNKNFHFEILKFNFTENIFKILIVLIIFLSCFSFYNSFAYDSLTVAGSSTIFPVILDAIPIFEEKTDISIDLKGGGSEAGIAGIMSGDIDVALVSRKLNEKDDLNLAAYIIGMDGIAVIVNKFVPIRKITRKSVIDIYTGKIKNWKDLCDYDYSVTLIAKSDSHGTRKCFNDFFNIEGIISEEVHLFDSNIESIAMVASDPGAIGYVSIGEAERARKLGVPVRLLDLEGIPATSQNVAKNNYPLIRELNLVVYGIPKYRVTKFIDFMQTEGLLFVKKHGFRAIYLTGE